MIEQIELFFVNLFSGNAFLATFFISMVPIIELKGAVPFGMSAKLFGGNALSPGLAWTASALGSLVPALLLVCAFTPIMNWLKRTKMFMALTQKIEQKFSQNAEKIKSNAETSKRRFLKKWFGLMLFVAIPLAFTGTYTGSAVASYLGLGYLNSVLAIFVGNIIAGGIVVLLCIIFAGYEIYVFLGFLVVLLVITLIKVVEKIICIKKNKIKEG